MDVIATFCLLCLMCPFFWPCTFLALKIVYEIRKGGVEKLSKNQRAHLRLMALSICPAGGMLISGIIGLVLPIFPMGAIVTIFLFSLYALNDAVMYFEDGGKIRGLFFSRPSGVPPDGPTRPA